MPRERPTGNQGSAGGLQPEWPRSRQVPTYAVLVPASSVQALGCQTTHSNQEVLQSCSLVFFATKPHILPAVLAEVAPVVTAEHVLVSVAAGVPLSSLEEVSGPWEEGDEAVTSDQRQPGLSMGGQVAASLQNGQAAMGSGVRVPSSATREVGGSLAEVWPGSLTTASLWPAASSAHAGAAGLPQPALRGPGGGHGAGPGPSRGE